MSELNLRKGPPSYARLALNFDAFAEKFSKIVKMDTLAGLFISTVFLLETKRLSDRKVC